MIHNKIAAIYFIYFLILLPQISRGYWAPRRRRLISWRVRWRTKKTSSQLNRGELYLWWHYFASVLPWTWTFHLKSKCVLNHFKWPETMQCFLNLPIWANFVDPTDLSLYLLLLPTLDQTSSIRCTQPHPQPQPGLDKQHWLRLRALYRVLGWKGPKVIAYCS